MPSRKESDEDDSGNNQDKPDASSFKPTEPEEAPSGEDSREEKSVAGRKKMKGGNSKDMRSGSQSPMDEGKKKGEHKTEKKEKPKSKEQRELEAEMNSILKRGPSECAFSELVLLEDGLADALCFSNYIL